MNCIGPTARSQVVSPSHFPPSVSRIARTPGLPSSGGPVIGSVAHPSASMCPPPSVPWIDSTRPMAARVDQLTLQPGCSCCIRSEAPA
jgi:hypothetical protein